MQRPIIQLIKQRTPAQLAAVRLVFAEYAEQLGLDLCLQNFAAELENLPGHCQEPTGALLLAVVDEDIAGCCALRGLDSVPNASKMKRLFVRQGFLRLGLGHQLAEAVLDAARMAGYRCVLLDTLDDMESARALFADCALLPQSDRRSALPEG